MTYRPSEDHRTGPGATLLLALAIGLLPACSALNDDPPPLADSLMVDLMMDLHLAKARGELFQDVPPGTRDSVLARHNLDRARYEAIMDYYVDHPEAYLNLYNQLLDEINQERRP